MANRHNTNRVAPTAPAHLRQPHGAACICHHCAPGVAAAMAAAWYALPPQRGSYNGRPVVPAAPPAGTNPTTAARAAARARATAHRAHRVPAGGRARYPTR